MCKLFDLFRRKKSAPAAQRKLAADWIILGLGNPGPKYAATRHNVGYLAVDDLLGEQELAPIPGVKALAAQLRIDDHDVLVLRSTTFMNLSGEAVAPLASQLGVPAERVIVLHDELDLGAGTVRIKLGGNENGHNGLKSVTDQLGTRDYLRVRIGISRPPKGMPVSDYVLSPLEEDAEQTLSDAAEAARLVITEGLTKAQNLIHGRRK